MLGFLLVQMFLMLFLIGLDYPIIAIILFIILWFGLLFYADGGGKIKDIENFFKKGGK
jgi:hypothetical protein